MKRKVGKVVNTRLWEHQFEPLDNYMRKRNYELLDAKQPVIERPDALRELVDAGLEAKGFKTVEA